MDRRELARRIDHTALGQAVSQHAVQALCTEAVNFGFGAVCVNSYYAPRAFALLKESGVLVCAVVGFPLGAHPARVKAYEARCAVEDGAEEIDMVLNIGALLDGRTDVVGGEIREMARAIEGKVLKVILETGLLTHDDIRLACRLAEEGGAGFVKTSTGFGPRGASVEDVTLMKASCGLLVKASGGIRTFEAAMALIEAGADRLGASAGIAILEGCS
jgi:deoxyribose-phosphate aldolase